MLLSFLPLRVSRLFKSRRLRKFLYRVKRYVTGSKGSFIFYVHNYLYRVLRNSKKRLLKNVYIRDLSRAIGKYYRGLVKTRGGFGSPHGDYLGGSEKSERCRFRRHGSSLSGFPSYESSVPMRSRSREGGGLHFNSTEYVEEVCGSTYDNNFVIDLYDEGNLPTDLQTSRHRDALNATMDPYEESGESHLSDTSRYEQSTNENIEYDEDEADENIKNCYLYNGYINAHMFKKSDEYKFMKEHFMDTENRNLKINIDKEQNWCDSDTSEWDWGKNHKKSLNQLTKRVKTYGEIKRKKERRKRRRYEIYNTETTAEQNLYCSNYLNEHFHSSSSVSSYSLMSSSVYSSDSSVDSSSDKETASLQTDSVSDVTDESDRTADGRGNDNSNSSNSNSHTGKKGTYLAFRCSVEGEEQSVGTSDESLAGC